MLSTAECPVCKTPISETRYAELQEEIRLEESRKLEELRSRIQIEAAEKTKLAVAEASQKITESANFRISQASLEAEKLKRDLDQTRNTNLANAQRHADELLRLQNEAAQALSLAVEQATKRAEEENRNKIALLEHDSQQVRDALKAAQLREAENALRHQEETKLAIEMAVADIQRKAAVDLDAFNQRYVEVESQRDALKLQAAKNLDDLRAEHRAELVQREQSFEATLKEAARLQQQAVDLATKELNERLSTAEKQVNDHELLIAQELQKQRAVLDNAKMDEIAKIRAQTAEVNESLKKKLMELERKLEQKTANELGQVPEAEIEKSLHENFPDDHIVRVKRGQPGVDIILTVKYKGEACGKIVIDSKNHLQWRDNFSEKLAQDCLDAEAKHGILSTSAFPKGAKDLSVRDGMILAKPNQVVGLVDVLRRTMIQSHILGLSLSNEGLKKDKLYELITSDTYRQSFQISERLLSELQQIDVEEASAHKKIWEQRGSRYRRLEKLMRETNDSIVSIVETTEFVAKNAGHEQQVIRARINH